MRQIIVYLIIVILISITACKTTKTRVEFMYQLPVKGDANLTVILMDK
jgi:hypothetical protein